MATLQVDTLAFHFQPSLVAQKYDESGHYLTVWQLQGKMAVDIVAMKMGLQPDPLWMIEAKDFRVVRGQPKAANISGLASSVFRKVVDTRDGLADAATNAVDLNERQEAQRAGLAKISRVVLHLEPHDGPHSKLFPLNFSGGVLCKSSANW